MKYTSLFFYAGLFLLLFSCGPAEEQTENGEADPYLLYGKEHNWFPFPEDPGTLIESDDQSFYKQTVVEGLTVGWGMTFLPDGRFLVTERNGDLYLVQDGEKHQVAGVPAVFHERQGGLLDIKAHPDFEHNGWIYFTYAHKGFEGNNTALSRAKLDEHTLVSVEDIFFATPDIPGGRHFGSRIVFQDDYVFITTADRGKKDIAQDSTNTSGSVIRLYHDGAIPGDNPFQDVEGAAPEIYTYGHRNPQGMDIHPETGDIWINEHGPKGGDEINIIKAGKNYGWPLMTYGVDYDNSIITEDTLVDGMEPCIHHWTPSIAPSGMTFVSGGHYPGWEGDVMNGALANQHLNRIVVDPEEDGLDMVVKEERLLEDIGRVRDVALDPDGFIYLSVEESSANARDGRIVRLLPEADPEHEVDEADY